MTKLKMLKKKHRTKLPPKLLHMQQSRLITMLKLLSQLQEKLTQSVHTQPRPLMPPKSQDQRARTDSAAVLPRSS